MSEALEDLLTAANRAFDGIGALVVQSQSGVPLKWSFFPRKDGSAGVYCRIDTGDASIKIQLQHDLTAANAEGTLTYVMTKAQAIINGIRPLIEEKR
jgi:hypothetical protein